MFRFLSILLCYLGLGAMLGQAMGWRLPSASAVFGLTKGLPWVGWVVSVILVALGVLLWWAQGKIRVNPTTAARWQRFRRLRRGYVSAVILAALFMLALLDQVLVGKRPLVMRHEGQWLFPAFIEAQIPGDKLGQKSGAEADYRRLHTEYKAGRAHGWMILPLVPWDSTGDSDTESRTMLLEKDGALSEKGAKEPYRGLATSYRKDIDSLLPEAVKHTTYRFRAGKKDGPASGFSREGGVIWEGQFTAGKLEEASVKWRGEGDAAAFKGEEDARLLVTQYVPLAPSLERLHYLGTDSRGWDIAAQLFGGWQVNIKAMLLGLLVTYAVGISLGSLMGYLGGIFDLVFQRFMEILGNIPYLYLIMIITAMVGLPNVTLGMLILIYCVFSWMGVAAYLRTTTYRERERDYVSAARVLGAVTPRLIFHHILPNSVSTIVTLLPFTAEGIVASLTALSFIGFGLPDHYPSWGWVMNDGVENLTKPWIVISVCAVTVVLLLLLTFVGEAVREAYDPKRYSTYR